MKYLFNILILLFSFAGQAQMKLVTREIPGNLAPTGLNATSVTASSFTLTWTAPPSYPVIAGYRVYMNSIYQGQTIPNTVSLSGLIAGYDYYCEVSTVDIYGRESVRSSQYLVTTAGGGGSALAAPVFRSEVVKPSTYYMSWDTVENADFYITERSPVSNFSSGVTTVQKGGGPAFLDYVSPGQTYYYRTYAITVTDTTKSSSGFLTRSFTAPAEVPGTTTTIQDKVRSVFTTHANARVTRAGGFTGADIGKIINIDSAKQPLWFKLGVSTFTGIITGISGDSAVLGTLPTSQVFTVGDSTVDLIAGVTQPGYYGTNNYDRLVDDVRNAYASGKNALRYNHSDSILVDPYRSVRWWNANYRRKQRNVTPDSVGIPINGDMRISGLKMILACKEFIGKQNTPTQTSHTIPYQIESFFAVKSGSLVIDSSIFMYDGLWRSYEIRTDRFVDLILWQADNDNRRVVFANSRVGAITDRYEDGWSSGFAGNDGNNKTGKRWLKIINSYVQSSEPLGNWGQNARYDSDPSPAVNWVNVNDYYSGTQVDVVNSTIDGSARPTWSIGYNSQITDSTVVIDSTINTKWSYQFYREFWRNTTGGRGEANNNIIGSWSHQNVRFYVNDGSTIYNNSVKNKYVGEFLYKLDGDTSIPIQNLSLVPPEIPLPRLGSDSAVHLTVVTDASGFIADHAGTFYYGIINATSSKHSPFTVLNGGAPITVAAGQAVDIRHNYPASGEIRIYRSQKNPASLAAAKFFHVITRGLDTARYDGGAGQRVTRDRNRGWIKPHPVASADLVFAGVSSQSAQVGDGHVIYPTPTIEMYWNNVVTSHSHKLIWRYNFDSGFINRGGNQFYIGNYTCPPIDSSTNRNKEVVLKNPNVSGMSLFGFGAQFDFTGMIGDTLKSMLWIENINDLSFRNTAIFGGGMPMYIQNSTVGDIGFPTNTAFTGSTRTRETVVKNSSAFFTIGNSRGGTGDGEALRDTYVQRVKLTIDNRFDTTKLVRFRYRGRHGLTVNQIGGRAGWWIDNGSASRVYSDSVILNYNNVSFGKGSFAFGTNSAWYLRFIDQARYMMTGNNNFYFNPNWATNMELTNSVPTNKYKINWPDSGQWSAGGRTALWNARMYTWTGFDWQTNPTP